MSIKLYAGTSFVPSCPSPNCAVTRQEREADALARVDNRVFFMGITKYGYQKPIREAVNPAFRDKYEGRPELEQFLPDPKAKDVDYGRLAEKFRSIDVYSGLVDGRNYGRVNRLYHQKIRHTRHPHGMICKRVSKVIHKLKVESNCFRKLCSGTEERFCVPLTDSMNYGWWIRDKSELDCTKWYATRERFPQVRGEITK
jgi:hypothetical protein